VCNFSCICHTLFLLVADLNDAFKIALKEAKKTTTYKQGQTKQPAITSDVLNIVNAMPLGYKDRARDSSLYLTALETGARAMTVEAGR
jgi:hypothetical protein